MNKFVLAVASLLLIHGLDADAQGRARVAGARANEQGGVTAGSASAASGPNGGRFARGGAVVTDSQGNAAGGSGAAVQTANGGQAARAGAFQRNADGSGTRTGGFAATGAQGEVASNGTATRNADGSVSGLRQTNASAASGETYTGGFYPDFTDTPSKAHTEPKECSCPSAVVTAPSTSGKPSRWSVDRGPVVGRSPSR
jgi:hypothetical protein